MKLKKIILALLTSVVIPFSASADNEGIKINVSTQDGKTSVLPMDGVSKITFGDTSFTMFVPGKENVVFEYDNVKKIFFSNLVSGICQTTVQAEDINIKYDGRTITVEGCGNNSILQLFDIAGRNVYNEKVNGSAMVSTDNLQKGVYIMKINQKTFKFNKR